MRLLRLLLTLGTQAPKNNFRLLDDKSMIGGWLQAGRRADHAVHICGETAAAADDVMVIVSDSRLIPCRMAGRLNASNESDLLQDMQIVVHGLRRERSDPLAGGVCNGFRIPMLALALDRPEYGEPRRSHSQTSFAKGFLKFGFDERHGSHYSP